MSNNENIAPIYGQAFHLVCFCDPPLRGFILRGVLWLAIG